MAAHSGVTKVGVTRPVR